MNVLVVVAYGVLGGVLGIAIKRPGVAIAVALLWLLVGESLIGVIRPSVAKWLPGSAARALSSFGISAGGHVSALSWPIAALVVAAYVVAAVTAGLGLVSLRDHPL